MPRLRLALSFTVGLAAAGVVFGVAGSSRSDAATTYEDLSLFRYAETAEEVWEIICDFHGLDPARPKF